MNTLIIAVGVVPVIIALVAVAATFGSVIITAVAEYEAARNRKARREADRRATSL